MKFKKGSKVVITLKGSPWENNKGVINGNDSGCFDTRVDFDSEWKDVLFNYKDMELYAKTYTEDQCRKKIELWKARLACVELKESTPEYTMEEAIKLIGHEFKIKK